jgi:hypothetical protein
MMRWVALLLGFSACGTVTNEGADGGVPGDARDPDAMVSGAALAIGASSQDFGNVGVGRQSTQAVWTLRNQGTAASGRITVEVVGGGAPHFQLTDECSNGTLEAGAGCELRAVFAPTEAGAKTATLRARATPGGEVAVVVVGNGIAPGALVAEPDTLTFGDVGIGTASAAREVTIRNTGGEASSALVVTIGDGDAFDVTADGCAGQALAAGASCALSVAFSPGAVGARSTSITLAGGGAGAVPIAVGGTGTAAVAVEISGASHGTVRSAPAAIDCGSVCAASFSTSPITLDATPLGGAQFSGWSGACSGSDPRCVLPLEAAKTARASFTFGLRVITSHLSGGAPRGRVQSRAAGIDCVGTCEHRIAAGEPAVLTAVPDSGQVFAGWKGACEGTAECRLTPSADVQVEAIFALARPTLTIRNLSPGCGAITTTPTGVSCGTDCSEAFPFGTRITVVAPPSSSRSCERVELDPCARGSGRDCTLVLERDTEITVEFDSRD